jgi:hypothetical protein
MHNYFDVNVFRRWRDSGTRRMLQLTRGRLWISETAGIVYYVREGRLGERHAAAATRWMLSLPRHSRRIRRVYAYQWQAECHPDTWDSAWFRADGAARPSYRAVVAALARERHLDAEAVKALNPPLWPGALNTCLGQTTAGSASTTVLGSRRPPSSTPAAIIPTAATTIATAKADW